MKEENQLTQQNAEVSQGNAEKPSEKPQSATEKPSEKPQDTTEKPSGKSQGTPEKPSEKPQSATEKPSGKSQGATEKPSEKPQGTTEKPSEKPQGTPEKPSEKPSENPSEKPSEKPQGLRLLPFNVKSETSQRFKSMFEKTNDETLNTLLDVYEKSQDSENANADVIKKLKNTIAEKNQLLQSMEKRLSESISEKELQEIKNRNGKLEEEARQNKKLIDAYRENKKNLEDTITNDKKVIENLQQKIKDLHDTVDNGNYSGYKGDDNFLQAFPELTARLLEITARKLTEARKDKLEVTPAMVLGDMFLKYTVQKRTMWFYRWVLTDSEILQVAQDINPNINSIRVLRRILKIDEELN